MIKREAIILLIRANLVTLRPKYGQLNRMNKYTTLFISLIGALCLSACDAEDPSLDYTAQYYSVGQVSLSNTLTESQRTVIGRLLDNMVKVEHCQFYMGSQARSTSRANYNPSYSSAKDSMKLTAFTDENGVITYTKNNWFVDCVHLLDKRSYRHTLSNGTVKVDTIYFTQIYRMPETSGLDNGHLWVGPVTEMSMPNDYYIGMYEVSQAEWTAVMGEGNWPMGRRCIEVNANDRRDSAWYAAVGRGDDYPAYNVWYEDALAFCERLNQLCNMPNSEGLRFRLPTEAEWECAARGGMYSRGFRYPGSDTYSDVAWYSGNAFTVGLGAKDFGMHPHGELEPNELGLYDMAGNVSEWVLNTYYRYTYRDSIANSAFDAKHMPLHAADGYLGDTLVLRGGSWYQSNSFAFGSSSRQEYSRGSNDAENLQSVIMHCGFRIVLGK
jgi:formylglycine-generating enzyme required for sulfatase activity